MSLNYRISNLQNNNSQNTQNHSLFGQNFFANRRASGKLTTLSRVNSEPSILPLKSEKTIELPKVTWDRQLPQPPPNFEATYQLDNLQRLKQSINENIESFTHQSSARMQAKVSKLSLFDRNTHLKVEEGPPTFLLEAPKSAQNS